MHHKKQHIISDADWEQNLAALQRTEKFSLAFLEYRLYRQRHPLEFTRGSISKEGTATNKEIVEVQHPASSFLTEQYKGTLQGYTKQDKTGIDRSDFWDKATTHDVKAWELQQKRQGWKI